MGIVFPLTSMLSALGSGGEGIVVRWVVARGSSGRTGCGCLQRQALEATRLRISRICIYGTVHLIAAAFHMTPARDPKQYFCCTLGGIMAEGTWKMNLGGGAMVEMPEASPPARWSTVSEPRSTYTQLFPTRSRGASPPTRWSTVSELRSTYKHPILPSGFWRHLQASASIWRHLGPSGSIWKHLDGGIWKHLEASGA